VPTTTSRSLPIAANQTLLREGVIAPQLADESHSAMLQAKATLNQQNRQPGLRKLSPRPFDGIVTSRNADPGHLVPAATSATAGASSVVTIARYKPLRVFTYVSQSIAPYIKDGDPATITVSGFPGRKFTGSITRHPDALSPEHAHDAGRSRSRQ